MVKSVRLGRMQMAYTFIHLIGPSEMIPYASVTQIDSTGKNVLHHAVMTKQKELVQRFIFIDSDQKTLRNTRDARNKTPQALDEQSQFTEMFVTVWDCAASGANVQLKQVLDIMSYKAEVAPKDQKTFWLGNTPLMLAVKHQQLETVRNLVQEFKANIDSTNGKNKTAHDFARVFIKDPNVLDTCTKLLKKQSTSTKVVHNREIIEERKQADQEKTNQIKQLRDELKAKLDERGIDV